MAPCKPGNQVCPPGYYGANTPQFHVKDASCGENDPNGPSYDPVHGLYHLHYQNHVGLHGGRTYGHAVSKDFTHWSHMPISIWNDQPYDSTAIYTGSATIVNGSVVQIYPGLCKVGPGCPGGTNLCIAVPADPADPLQTNWSKGSYATNPIVNNTGRDPSTAWQTPSGEWRLTTFDTHIMGSMDFKHWYHIGTQTAFPGGECPSFFPLPPSTPGAGPAPAGAGTPTHVHKASHGGKDWMQVGSYTAGAPKVLGNWESTAGVPRVDAIVDVGDFYASKDFWDPVKKRRINWGWARVPPSSTQTLPRVVTWHPELQQLVFSPVEEQAALRALPALATMPSVTVGAGAQVSLGSWPDSVGNQSEVTASFQLPTKPATFGIGFMTTAGKPTKEAFVSFVPASEADAIGVSGSWKVRVGVRATTTGDTTGDTAALAEARPPPPPAPGSMLNLLPADTQIEIRIFMDNTFAEVYFMGGRVAITSTTAATDDAGFTLFSDAAVTAVNVSAYHVDPIWVSPAEVKSTPRVAPRAVVA